MIVQDIDRPDINGIPPKMQAISELMKEKLSAPYLRIQCSDNLCSSVMISGALVTKEEFPNGILQNAPFFMIQIRPATRYYTEGQEVSAEMFCRHYKLPKMRKYTSSSPEKVAKKIQEWIEGVI